MKDNYKKFPNQYTTLTASLCWLLFQSPGIMNGESADNGLNMAKVGPRTVNVEINDYAGLRYVSAAVGSDKKGVGTEESPWASIHEALRNIDDADASKRYAVLVAAGAYFRGTIQMKEHIDLYGGFDTETWKRDIFKDPTILDGREIRRVVIGASHSRLDGFIVTRGRAQGPGGGILCDGTSPLITNNRINHNATVAPADFRSDIIHQEGNIGGGIACFFNAVPRIANNVFSENKTEVGDGGGLAIYGWNRLPNRPRAEVENNVFVGNASGTKDFYRTRSSSGGAISCSHESSPLIRNNVIASNRAGGRSDAGGIYSQYYSSPEIVGNWIVGNVSDDDGGGFYTMRLGEPILINNILAGNWTTGGGVGGARVSKEGRAVLIGNKLVQNLTGGGLLSVDSRIVLKNNVIADNEKGPGFGYRQNFDYYQASVIEGNYIFGNEQGSLSIEAPKGAKPKLADNWLEEESHTASNALDPRKAVVTDDGLTVKIASTHFNESEATSLIEFNSGKMLSENLAGRILRLKNQWTVVLGNDESSLTVWGNIATQEGNTTAEILPTYRIR